MREPGGVRVGGEGEEEGEGEKEVGEVAQQRNGSCLT